MTSVVLADDHEFVRVGIARLLSRHKDIQVVGEAKNGLEAVECVERFHPDVLVLDMEMPGLNGLGVLRSLQQKGLWVNVLVLSAYDSPEYIRGVKTLNWTPFPGKLWQRNYYEHIIRNEIELSAIRQYIINNPLKWEQDRDNPIKIRPAAETVAAYLSEAGL